jgi:hypothetical protein
MVPMSSSEEWHDTYRLLNTTKPTNVSDNLSASTIGTSLLTILYDLISEIPVMAGLLDSEHAHNITDT